MYAKLTQLTALSFLLAGSQMIQGQNNLTSNRAAKSIQMREVAARSMVAQGALGSPTRKPARTFSGNIEHTFAQPDPGQKGTPTLPTARQPSGTAANMVTIRSSRQAQFVIGSGAAPKAKTQTEVAHVVSEPWAELTSPAYGVTLAPVQTFTWTAGTGVTEYYLWIGSCHDCTDLLDQDEGLNKTQTVALPVDGRRIYATLFSWIDGNWYWVDYQFNAASSAGVAATLTSPANGSTLSSPQTFTWSAGYLVTDYYLWIGSCPGCNDIVNEDENQNLSRTLTLPAGGATVYLTLFSYIQGNWFYWQYEFQEATGQPVRVFVDNELGYALNVYINGNAVGSVDAFNTQYADATVASLTVSFELIQPTLNGKALGDPVSGYFQRIDNPSGDYTFTVNNQIGNDFYMLPEISNDTGTGLDIDVNAGLTAENKCYCSAPAYTQNVTAGYYQLFSNSNVRLYITGRNYTGPYEFFGEDSNGEIASSGLLYKFAAANSGIVHLVASFVP
jgi:hypothetical protein